MAVLLRTAGKTFTTFIVPLDVKNVSEIIIIIR